MEAAAEEDAQPFPFGHLYDAADALYAAAADGDLSAVTAALQAGADVDARMGRETRRG